MRARYKEFVRDKYYDDEDIPWWKGYVRNDYYHYTTTVAPIGFNVLFAIVYWVFIVVRVKVYKFKEKRL